MLRRHGFSIMLFVALASLALPGQALAAKIVVYGASGSIGSLIVSEALSRGHTVVGVSRDPARLKRADRNFSAVAGDVTDPKSFLKLTRGADAVIISVAGSGQGNLPENSVHAQAARVAVQVYNARKRSPYILEIGGATTLHETREAMLANLPFPAAEGSEMYGMLFGHLVALQTFRASRIRWTVLTPPNSIEGWTPGGPPQLRRTGQYRVATSGWVRDAAGNSAINIADLAVAAVDEIEQQRHVGRRFTVGY